MKRICVLFLLLILSVPACAEELIRDLAKVVVAHEGRIPQAPRVSPNGRNLVYEMYSKEKVTLWLTDLATNDSHCLTCNLAQSVENAYWHPSGKYLTFNVVPKGNRKDRPIFVADITEGVLGPLLKIGAGARPQFSRPNGNVVLFETAQENNNILAYQILGPNPLSPSETINIELRGPIQQVNQNAEVSHPSLAPDGTTIVFAARASSIKGTDSIVLNDTDRQKIFRLRKALRAVPVETVQAEFQRLSEHFHVVNRSYGAAYSEVESIVIFNKNSQQDIIRSEFERIMRDSSYLSEPTIVDGYTKRHLFLSWYSGALTHIESSYDQEVAEQLFPRLWTTDVFGAPLKPLVEDLSSTPLPQKWPTVSHDGRFVVFEAGDYTNRHIYLVAKKTGEWSERAIKLTESGTYNSSPELDPSGEWLYFESNRDGAKGIWRAKLNWPAINAQLGL